MTHKAATLFGLKCVVFL